MGDDRPFTLWGFLDAGADTQKVRVFSIEERIGLDRAGPIDAVVTSTDLDTGERRTWTDSEVTFADGSVGHVFWSPFRAVFEHRYRLEVTRSDGATSSVEVFVPPPIDVRVDRESDETVVPATILGFPPRFVKMEVVYDVSTVPPANAWPPGSPNTPAHRYPVTISYDGEAKRTDEGWTVEILLARDFALIQEEFEKNCLTRDLIIMRRMDFRFLVANDEWVPPGGAFDPDVLIVPGTFSNVKNGFGFFGGGYTVSTRWVPKDAVLEGIGYTFSPPCAFGPQDIPACQLPPEPCFEEE